MKLFNFGQNELRVIEKDGEPWFVLKNVCEVLEIAHIATVKQRLTDDVVSNHPIPDALGRMQDTTIISEDGLYDVILESRKPEARSFRKWITSEVIPSIRKTGTYSIDRPSYMIDDPIDRAQKWIDEERHRQALISLNRERDEQLYLQAPKVALYDTAMSAHNNFTMERVSKTIGYGRNKLFDFLREIKVLRTNNMPYQEYLDRGYFDVRQYSITHLTSGIENKTQTLVTPKGMAYIHKLLTEYGKIA